MASQKTTQLNEGGNPLKHGPRDWLRQTAGAAAHSAGSAAHAVASVGATFSWPVRVYWEDTDAGGIVFYANYLKFFERARTEWLRSLGIEQQRLKESSGGMFVVAETSLRYLRPARLDDELIVTASLLEAGRASMIISQQVLLKSEHVAERSSLKKPAPAGPSASAAVANLGTILCEGSIRIGWVDAASMQPARIPAAILERLSSPA